MKSYDTIYVNGKIFTSDDSNPFVQAMAVTDGHVSWVGKSDEAKSLLGDFVNLKGATVIPGLVDSHMHPIMLAESAVQITCLPPEVNSIEELIAEIKKVSAEQGNEKWIMGWGYDESKLAEGRSLTRYDLDQGASDTPVCIFRSCGHIRCVNSKALELANINQYTVAPEGGEIELDSDGIPTGVLKENARNLLNHVLPPTSREQVIKNLIQLSPLLLSVGVTSVSDMCNLDNLDYYDAYLEASKKGFLQRVGMFYLWDTFKDDPKFTIPEDRLSALNQIKVCGLKLLCDGGISGRTAWCNRPYLGGGGNEYGISTCSDQLLQSAIDFCKEHHAQLAIHAMGQSAIEQAVYALSKAGNWLDGNIPYGRIEHASMPTPDSITLAARHGIAFALQPVFLYAERDRYLENLGESWLHEIFPVKDLLDAGVVFSFSSDAPATPLSDAYNPFICIQAAVTRRSEDKEDCGQRHRVDVETAIKLYTREGARIMGFENVGQLKEGYDADFAVLDRDIFTIPEETISKVHVNTTYIRGQQVYSRT